MSPNGQYIFHQTWTPKDFPNGKPPPRKRSCTYCQSRHYACDKEERHPDRCGNCQAAGENCVYPTR
ncbi:hypothetical protein BD410DRAFT_795366, partial [Rickenella mellea]